jgi:hypothetical protein
MANESLEARKEAIPWTIGTLVVVALLTYTAWDSARDNARLAEQAQSTQQAPARH